MATKKPEWQAPKQRTSIMQWLLDSDPSIRWQVMRDLAGEPAEVAAAVRARVPRSTPRSASWKDSWSTRRPEAPRPR
jgi:hypothetical protein